MISVRRISAFLLAGLLLQLSLPAQPHPLAPALLELEQTGDSKWSVLWRQSTRRDMGPALEPVFPDYCEQISEDTMTTSAENRTSVSWRWAIHCGNNPLLEGVIEIRHLQNSPINVILRIIPLHQPAIQTLLNAETSQWQPGSDQFTQSVWQRYLLLGIEHLLKGPDHLLFLLGLILLSGMNRSLIITLTAFTLGHSVTLSLTALELISFNAMLMEFGIAVSLVVVARELLCPNPTLLSRRPGMLAAAFGLLHGMGFAGALNEIGLPAGAVAPALLSFNIGIEIGQLIVVGALFIVLKLISSIRRKPMSISGHALATGTALSFGQILPAYIIGGLAMMWCIERLAFLGESLPTA